MPEEKPVPYTQPADLESEPLQLDSAALSKNYALALVMSTFHQAENFRVNNHDRRWNVHDELYFGWVPPKVWEGTNVPRAAISNQIVFDQVESLIPSVTQALFNTGPEWFQVEPEKGTTLDESRQIQDVMSYYLEHPVSEFEPNAQAEIELAIKDVGLYGNGGVSLQWDMIQDAPRIERVDIRDLYIDPGTSTPCIDHSGSVIHRKMMTIQDLMDLKSDARMDIPDAEILYTLARNYGTAHADTTKSIQEAIRGVYYAPGSSDYSSLPSARKVEVFIYYSKARIIWVLGRQWVAYNQPNPYKFIPFCIAPCYIVPNRFYAQSVADVQEGNQRYTQALLNGHLDELSLQLHPPRTMPRASNLTPAQLKWKPGALYQIDNPKDAQIMTPGGATANVFNEIQYLELAADKRTGITALGGGGVPRPSNANRTAGGMQMQLQGSNNRLSHLVGNVEKYLITPLLYKLYHMIKFHKHIGDTIPAANAQQGPYEVSADIINKKCKFRMNAASKMVTRDKLLQVFPILAQYIMQGPLIEQLQNSGKTVDFEETFKMLQDATNVGKLYQLIRPISPQEQQAMQQQAQQSPDMQKAQLEAQTRTQISQQKNQTELQKEQISQNPNPIVMQMEAAQMHQEMQIEREKAQLDAQVQQILAAIKIQSEKQKHQMDLASKQMDMQVQQQGHQQEMQRQNMSHQMEMQHTLDNVQMNRYAQEQGVPTSIGMGGPEQQMGNSQSSKSSSSTSKQKKTAQVRKKTRPTPQK